jgi:Flp pilus assembly pilin Flp
VKFAPIFKLIERSPLRKADLRRLLRDERGLSTVEYVILLAVIVVGAVGIWTSIGDNFKTSLGRADDELGTLTK